MEFSMLILYNKIIIRRDTMKKKLILGFLLDAVFIFSGFSVTMMNKNIERVMKVEKKFSWGQARVYN